MNPTTDTSTTYEQTDVVAYHGKLAADWEGRYQKRSFQVRIEVLEECLQGRKLTGTRWLDAGCGTGTLTRFLAERGCSVTGLDAAPRMIEIARERAQEHSRKDQMRFEVADRDGAGTMERLAYAVASLDGILCSSVLEYIPQPEQHLGEFARTLKPGGLLLISVPNAQSAVRRAQVGVYRWGRRLGQRWLQFIEYSRNEYSASAFEALLNAHHFEVEKVIVFGSPIPRWIQRQQWGGSLLMFAAVRK